MNIQTNAHLLVSNELVRRGSVGSKENLIEGHLLPSSTRRKRSIRRWMNAIARPGCAYSPTCVEHVANIISHAVWVLPSAHFLISMMNLSVNTRQEVAVLTFGVALIMLFLLSTLFHVVSWIGNMSRLKEFFHRGDRAMIYVFIAASYYPWLTLLPLPVGTWTEILPVAIWILAFMGIMYQQLFHERYKWLEIVIYVFVGVIPGLTIALEVDELHGLDELAVGGLFYLFGIIFFKSDGRIPFAHAIWHLHVIGGSYMHYSAICSYLLGPDNVRLAA